MIPIKTDLVIKRPPYANYALIAVNIIIFALSYQSNRAAEGPLQGWTEMFILNSARPQIWQFVTYSFLHSGLQHIIGNMFFLYLFGNNVNDRLGHTGYICFYIAGSIFAGVGYSLLNSTPVLGASGAVSAITGAYLVLFPRSVITVLYWFVIIGTIEVPAIWFILLKMVLIDNIIQARYMTARIAYDAHLAGYAFGIVAPLILLWAKLLPRSRFDMFTLIRQWNRRRMYREAIKQSDFDPDTGININKVKVDENESPEEAQRRQKIYKLRSEISSLKLQKRLKEACRKYIELIEFEPSQVLSLGDQLDIANYLMSIGDYKRARQAYESFVKAYPQYHYTEQIYLMLGIIYGRYLKEKEPAKKYLELAAEGLRDENQRKVCRDELKKIQDL